MVSPQASTLASVALLIASLVGLCRLFVLRLSSSYPSLVFFFACEFAIVAASETVGVTTPLYAYSFGLLVLLEWVAFGFVLRELYGAVFAQYRAIEFLGRWSMYAALAISCVLGWAGAASTGHLITEKRTAMFGLEFASSCMIIGSVLLVGFILIVISRYPLALQRNVVINCRLFALFMLVEAIALLIDRFTQARYTVSVNVVDVLFSAFILLVWPLLLSRKGEVTVFKLRRRIDSGEEARLLGQLNAFNGLLLRVARK